MSVRKNETYIDGEIRRLLLALQELEPNTKEYGETVEQLQKLHKIRQDEKPDRVSADAMFSGAVSILGIVTILQYEHLHPIASKAISFIKLR